MYVHFIPQFYAQPAQYRCLQPICCRFMANLQVIMNTCLQSMHSMGAIVGLMLLFMCILLGLSRGKLLFIIFCCMQFDFYTQLFSYYIGADMFAVIGRGMYAHADPTRFGSLWLALFTLFQLLTLDDWFFIYEDVVKTDPSQCDKSYLLSFYVRVDNSMYRSIKIV